MLVKQAGLEGTPLEAHTRLLRWLVQGEDVICYAFIGIFIVLTAAVLLVMLVVIKNSYTLSVVEKSDLYGVLRCLNATGKQVQAFVMWEGLITWGIALPLGCLAAWIAMRTIITMAANLGVTMLAGLSMQSPSWPYLCAAAASFATMLLAMQGACKRACSITPVEAFRGNDPFQKDKSKPMSRLSIQLGTRLKTDWLLVLRDQQKNKGRFRITVTAIAINVAMFTCFTGAAITLTDFMGSYIDRSGTDFYFSSSHHVEKSPQLFADLRNDLSQYPEITGMQEVYPIEFLLDVPENRTNYAELQFAGSAPSYDDLLTNGTVIPCQSEVFRKNGMMNVTEFGTFRAGDKVRMAQRVNDEMLQIRELTVAAVLTDTPWFAPERTHGFILVPMETIDGYFEQATSVTNLYTTGMMSIRGNEEQLAALHSKLYERSISAFGALNGFVFNSPYMNNQDVEKQVALINLVVYGFIVLIAIICALNIFNTVWADLESRRREIALLRAVGMDSVQLINYLHGGCLMYAVFGMVPGTLVGYLVLTAAIQ